MMKSRFLLLVIFGAVNLLFLRQRSWNTSLEFSKPPRFYNTSGAPLPSKLNVHLVPHTHDDVGWLKTVDQYYVGSNNSIQIAGVQYILDSVISCLEENPDRKFIYVEQAFFQRWWRQQTEAKKKVVKKLVASGQLEFINGGWCMHDEAGASYIDMIDQTTLGHRFIKSNFDKVPRIGWQIDPFGHSAVQAYLLGAEVGFDGLFFARADYQDIAKRRATRGMEFIWRGSKSFDSSAQIFAGVLANHYSPPEGMSFDIRSNDPPIQDDPLLYDFNLQERIDLFVKRAQDQSEEFRSNHIMWTMGQDFNYENANTWFKQLDKVVHYMNKDGRTNVFYSSPSIYVDSKNAANVTWPLKTEDFFPYSNCSHCYWTGYFSSRLALKGYVRRLSGYLLAARQLEFFIGRNPQENTDSLEDSVAILQHHDGVTGTEQQHVADDYSKRLSFGAAEAAKVMNKAISLLTSFKKPKEFRVASKLRKLISSKFLSIFQTFTENNNNLKFQQCPLLNISHCPASEAEISENETLVVTAYNPLAWSRKEFIRITVSSESIQVRDSAGNEVLSQTSPLDSVTKRLRDTYVAAYTGSSPNSGDKFNLVFEAVVPPLGFTTYFISQTNKTLASSAISFEEVKLMNALKLSSGSTSLEFLPSNGQMKMFTNQKSGMSSTLTQSYCWYNSSNGFTQEAFGQPSGAYVFRPNSSTCFPVEENFQMETTVIKGPLVQEVYQVFSPWVSQVVRLYKDADHVEFEYTVGPIPVNSSDAGKEVIARLNTNLTSNEKFYTDSNARDFLERRRDFRKDWDLNVTEPIAGNYYPLNLAIYLQETERQFSVLVDRAIGGSSLEDGSVELMIQRRLLYNDHRGVQEALNETLCLKNKECEGLTDRGVFLVNINSPENSARWRRSQGQKLYSPLELFFSHIPSKETNSIKTSFSSTESNYELPPNIAMITLQELESGEVLLRLAHLYEIDEDKELSSVVRVDIQKLFASRKIEKIIELNLSANQERAAMKKPLDWKLDQSLESNMKTPIRGPLLQPGDLQISIAPMEIRTLQVSFK